MKEVTRLISTVTVASIARAVSISVAEQSGSGEEDYGSAYLGTPVLYYGPPAFAPSDAVTLVPGGTILSQIQPFQEGDYPPPSLQSMSFAQTQQNSGSATPSGICEYVIEDDYGQHCDTYCQPLGGYFQWNEAGSYTQCILTAAMCNTQWISYSSGSGYCDSYCVISGGEWVTKSDGTNSEWQECSWSTGTDEYGKCHYPITDSAASPAYTYCDTYCQPYGGYFEAAGSGTDANNGKCKWDNVCEYGEDCGDDVEITYHSCHSTHDLNKATNVDFYGLRDNTTGATTQFTDENFPHEDALYWFDRGTEAQGEMANQEASISWTRLSSLFTGSLFDSTGGIKPSDIRMGNIDNSFFLAGVAALAEYPQRIKNLLVDDQVNYSGIYAYNMYALGVNFTQIIDDYLPLMNDGTNVQQNNFANPYWVSLLEKAFAKLNGNYQHIVEGHTGHAVSSLNGSPFTEINHSFTSAAGTLDYEAIWQSIREIDSQKAIVTATTRSGASGVCTDQHDYGLRYCHAYAAIQSYELSDGSRLIKMRDPAGNQQYNGFWKMGGSSGATRDNWTQEAIDVTGRNDIEAGDDGVFFMSLDEYVMSFDMTTINLDTRRMHQGSFLMFDDPEYIRSTNAGDSATGCMDCTMHTLEVTSKVDQKVYIGAHVWQERGYSEHWSCLEASGDGTIQHEMWSEDNVAAGTSISNRVMFDAHTGSGWFEQPIEMFANVPLKINLVFDWNRHGVTKDWALTAWGQDGDVEIEHSLGIESEKMPCSGVQRPDTDDWDDDDRSDGDGTAGVIDFKDHTPQYDEYVKKEDIDDWGFHCMLNIRNEWDDGYYSLFAGHDCTFYSLKLSIIAQDKDLQEYIVLSTTGIEDQHISTESMTGGYTKLVFRLKPESSNTLGIKFSANADANFYYETDWEYNDRT